MMRFKEFDTRDGMSQEFKNDTSEHEWNDNHEDKKQINANAVYTKCMWLMRKTR